MNVPQVSVVVPNFNCGRFLREAIDSVLKQSHAAHEIIVVDDGSTDDSLAVLETYGDRIRVVTQRNQGVSVARNTGIEHSRGEIVAFLDADDMWRPEKLAKQVALFENHEVGLVYCAVEYIDEAARPLGTNLTGRRGRVPPDIALLNGTIVLAGGSTTVVRKASFDRVGMFDPRMSTAADWDMWRRLACHDEIDVVREPLMLYRLRPAGMHRQIDVFERDMLHGVPPMFADPAAAAVRPLRRRAYAKLFLMLSDSHLEAGQLGQAFKYACRSLALSPAGLGYVAALALRRWRRHRGEVAGEPRLAPFSGGQA